MPNRGTYVVRVDVEEEEPGRWSAVVPDLPGCYGLGDTREEAIGSLEINARDYLRTLKDMGRLPEPIDDARFFDGPVLALSA